MNKSSINILLCGIGGQGIASATRKVHEHCLIHDWQCISAVYKGGAQRLGTVKAEIRLFPPNSNSISHKSSQIIPGTLDALVVMEHWEGLRQLSFCNPNTLIILNSFAEFPPGNQQIMDFDKDPNLLWEKISNEKISNNFLQLSQLQFGHSRHAATLMINEAIENLKLNLKKINY